MPGIWRCLGSGGTHHAEAGDEVGPEEHEQSPELEHARPRHERQRLHLVGEVGTRITVRRRRRGVNMNTMHQVSSKKTIF